MGDRRLIPIGVIAHKSRRDTAEQLADKLGAVLFMDEGDPEGEPARLRACVANHERAWAWAAKLKRRAIILEDDVTPVSDLRERAVEWFTRFPDDLLNFYLGTGWSHIEQQSVEALEQFDAGGPDLVRLDSLWGCQAYSIPPHHIPAVLADHRTDIGPDFSLGASWMWHTGNDSVVHVLESLVEHDDLPSTVWLPENRPNPRRARRLHVATSQAPVDRRRQHTRP